MRRTTKKKQKGSIPAPDADETVRMAHDEVKQLRNEDSEQIERAVYDGMVDLRAHKRPKK